MLILSLSRLLHDNIQAIRAKMYEEYIHALLLGRRFARQVEFDASQL